MRNLIFGALLAAFAVVLWTVLIPYGVTVPRGATNIYLAPDFWIRIIAGSMFVIGAIMGVTGWRMRATGDPDGASGFDGDDPVRAKRYLRLGGGIALFGAYYLAIEPLGMVFSSALALFIASLFYGERRFHISVPLSVILPVGLYFFFLKVALIPMPLGILEGVGPF